MTPSPTKPPNFYALVEQTRCVKSQELSEAIVQTASRVDQTLHRVSYTLSTPLVVLFSFERALDNDTSLGRNRNHLEQRSR